MKYPLRDYWNSLRGRSQKEFRAFEAKANELLKRFGCVCRLKHFTPADIPVIFVAEEKESTTKSTNNPLAAVLGTVRHDQADTSDADI